MAKKSQEASSKLDRQFGERKYKYFQSFKSKNEANRIATDLRSKKNLVRIIKSKTEDGHEYDLFVFENKPSRKKKEKSSGLIEFSKTGHQGKIVMKFLDEYPKVATLTLAKMIYNTGKNNTVFNSVETVRSRIRYYRGQQGEEARREIQNTKYFTDPSANYNPYRLPDTDAEEIEDFVLSPNSHKKILVMNDLHLPYHDIEAISVALQYGEENDMDTILLNGDVFDFYGISRWEKDPTKRKFQEEIEMGRMFFSELRANFPDIKIYCKWGNHEYRFEAYLKQKAPELFGLPEIQLKELFRFGQYKITEIGDKQLIRVGKLCVVHGHEFGQSFFSPVNPARGLFLRAKASIMAGHYHQTSEHVEKNIKGEITACWSVGCLCHLKPEYRPYNKWNHGAAMITLEKDGTYEVDNFKIIGGRIR